MVVKSCDKSESQQPIPTECVNGQKSSSAIRKTRASLQSRVDLMCNECFQYLAPFFLKIIIIHVVNLGKRLPINGSGKRTISRTSVALTLLAIPLLAQLVHGAGVNSTLADDLLMNNNHGDGNISSTPSPTSDNDNRTTSPSTSASSSSTTETFTTTTSSPLPSSAPLPKNAHTGMLMNDNDHINFTIPIQVGPDTAIFVKHGSIIYELINNQTVTKNVGTFTIPILTTPPRLSVYQPFTATIYGLRVEESAKGVTYDHGASVVLANARSVMRLFGTGFTNNTIIRFVTEEGERGADCDDVTSTKYFHFDSNEVHEHSAVVTVQLPPMDEGEKFYYVCVKEDDKEMPWIHQGTEQWIVLTSYQKWLPVWAHIICLLLLLILSGLFSGLNLGLMAIDRTEIKIIINAGSDQERRHAKKIRPLRDNGNYLLCSLLLGNVLVNATLTILLDDLTSGLIAVIVSTVGIVIFGEIVPQAVCSRHGLAVGAKTVWITKIFMAITFPLSYPISVCLDKILGEEIGNVYNRERLKELIRVTQGVNDLEKDELNIIAGALELKQKTVVDVMTRLENTYMLPIDAILDFDTVSEIMSNGYSRIPVYESFRGNVISLLYAKDLAFVDPDDRMPLRTICEFYSNPCHFVFENVTLDVLFKVFKQGNKGHMAFVQKVKANDKSDPIYEVIGLVTLEDVIEELIQEEINDESDVWEVDHRRRNRGKYNSITEIAMNHWKSEGTTVSPQLTLAAFQYMSTAVDEFNDSRISKTVLERMLKQNIYFNIKIKNKDTMKTDPGTILYERGKPADYFVMILEGKVNAEIGRENLVFESGPFTYFGTKSLTLLPGDLVLTPVEKRKTSTVSTVQELAIQNTFVPDYTVRAVTDLTYFRISRSMYLAATQATLLEKCYSPSDITNDEKIDAELLKHVDEINGNFDCKTKEKPLAIKAPGDICEEGMDEKNIADIVSQSNHLPHEPAHPHQLHQPLTDELDVVIGDNNNISMPLCPNGGNLHEKPEELHNRNNMSRVIIYPLADDKSLADPLQETNFPGKIIVDGEEKYFCKL